jgi:hypothetical protein
VSRHVGDFVHGRTSQSRTGRALIWIKSTLRSAPHLAYVDAMAWPGMLTRPSRPPRFCRQPPVERRCGGHAFKALAYRRTGDLRSRDGRSLLRRIHYVRSSSRAPGSISGRSISNKSRVSLLKQPLRLHNPGCGFVFAAETGDRPELTTCCRHLDIEGAIALWRYLECRDCHPGQYVRRCAGVTYLILSPNKTRLNVQPNSCIATPSPEALAAPHGGDGPGR